MSANLNQQATADYRDINGKAVASAMLSQVSRDVSDLQNAGWQPRLVSIRIGEHPSADLYIRNQERAAQEVGIGFERRNFPADISEVEVRAALMNLNVDPGVT